MTALQWMLGSLVIISLIMLIVALSETEEESSAEFCTVLAEFFLLSVLFFAIAIMFNA